MNENEIQRTIELLEQMNDSASFVFLAGDENGLECTLASGTHEPTGVHLHLLAVHLDALSQRLGNDVEEVAQLGLNAYEQMQANGAVAIQSDE